MSNVSAAQPRRYTEISSEETLPPGEMWTPSPKGKDRSTTTRTEEAATRHFTDADAKDLGREPSTDETVRGATGKKVHIHGRDKTQRDVAAEQKTHIGIGGVSALATAVEGAEIIGHSFGLGVTIATPIVGFGLGVTELMIARKQGAEQADALARENIHVALVGALDLPAAYKASRYAAHPGVSRENGTEAFRMTEKLRADPKLRAGLQHRADMGMLAARDCASMAGTTKEKVASFLAAHPKIEDLYENDAAFREGFEAYLHTKQSGGDVAALDRRLDAGHVWRTETTVQVRG